LGAAELRHGLGSGRGVGHAPEPSVDHRRDSGSGWADEPTVAKPPSRAPPPSVKVRVRGRAGCVQPVVIAALP
jgi:hypothetical protein